MTKNLIYRENRDIAPLAWLAEVRPGERDVHVIHGSSVEVRPTFFAEGAWAGAFETGELDTSISFASGATTTESGITFCPPDHTLAPLYVRRDRRSAMVSNSLGLLMAMTGDQLKPEFHAYFQKMEEIADGVSRSPVKLPMHQLEYEMYYWNPFVILDDGSTRIIRKDRHIELKTFSDYRNYLYLILEKTLINMKDSNRKSKYKYLTPLSSGYDSTAIAVLASELGELDAVSFSRSRERSGSSSGDDGSIAASRLGMRLQIVDRLDYLHNLPDEPGEMPEVETMGAGSEFSSLRPHISQRALLVGFMGDTMWERAARATTTDIGWRAVGGAYAGHNFREMCLWHDAFIVPVPFIAALQHDDIVRISNDPAMAPWTLGTGYDRPICRRIGEEAGIPREAFGQQKKAAGVFHREEGLAQTMTKYSYQDYSDFVQNSNYKIRTFDIMLSNILYQVWRINKAAAKRIHRQSQRVFGVGFSIPILLRPTAPLGEGSLLFSWAARRMCQRYERALGLAGKE